jgi:serine/threonine protein kinase
VQALEGSVRAGNAYQPQQQNVAPTSSKQSSSRGLATQSSSNNSGKMQQQQLHNGCRVPWGSESEIAEVVGTTEVAEACSSAAAAAATGRNLAPASPTTAAAAATAVGRRGAQSGSNLSIRWGPHSRQQDLCPDLLEQLHAGLAATRNSQKFIEATQKVGSLMYMSPEVLTGHQYNEKIDVFSFGIILYELLSGVVVAGRVAMEGEHEQLLDYARQVANGHREPLPSYWPSVVKQLISDCWAQDPIQRPGFKDVMKRLYALKQAGVDQEMDRIRPKANYNPVTDCGCCIM